MMTFFHNAIAEVAKCISELLQYIAEIFAYIFVIKKTIGKLKNKNKK